MTDLDAQLRDRLVPDDDLAYEDARARSVMRCNADHLVTADGTRHRPWRPRRRRGLAIAGTAAATAAAVIVAVALAPDHAGEHATPLVPATASAAQTLRATGSILRDDDATTAGSGPVWHSVTRTYHEGDLVSVRESWFDTAAPGANLFVAWGHVDADMPRDGDRDVVLVDRLRADGTRAIRTAERRPGSSQWHVPDSMDPTNAMEIAAGDGTRQGALSFAVRDWLRSLASEPSEADLQRATRTFIATTRDQFQTPPPIPDSVLERMRDGQHPGGWAVPKQDMDALAHLDRIRAVMYLLTTVQASGEQAATMYDLLGGFDTLRRLNDVTIDGRRAYRIRFDLRDAKRYPFVQQVAVIDARSGRLVRTETLDRSAWSIVEPATRVTSVGNESQLCAESLVDCRIVAGTGPIEHQAAAFLQDERARYSAHGNWPMRFDNGTATTRDDDAFVIGRWLSPLVAPTGIVQTDGACSRDWRMLTFCAG